MPLYEYSCHKCGKRFEAIQKFSDEPLKVHADCGGVVERLISAPALQFKGSGWYITDYAKSGGSSKEAGKADGSSASNGSSDTKSDTKKSDSTPAPAASTTSGGSSDKSS